jgi:hypothetical protein
MFEAEIFTKSTKTDISGLGYKFLSVRINQLLWFLSSIPAKCITVGEKNFHLIDIISSNVVIALMPLRITKCMYLHCEPNTS